MKSQNTPTSPPNDATEAARPLQKRALETRQTVLKSVVKCLDELGYAETSFRAIQVESGLSRGSINYHFPTRHDMIVATTEWMLENAKTGARMFFDSMQNFEETTAYKQITQLLWLKVVNTAEGRAFVELLAAARTDPVLESAFHDMMRRWDGEIDEMIRETYPADPDTMVMVWDLCRTYLRGLLLQSHPNSDPGALQAKVDRFAEVVSQFVNHRNSGC